MTVPGSVVIVGGGLAGFTLAQSLRQGGYEQTITLIDQEGLPYDRPPLSKAYLMGNVTAESLLFQPESWYAENDIDLVVDRVVAVRPGTGRVELASGPDVVADAVVLATGGHARQLPVPGGDLPGLHVMRTKADSNGLKAVLGPGVHLAILGPGTIGAEVASAAHHLGCQVSIVGRSPLPLVGLVGRTLARRLHNMHAEHGVSFQLAQTSAITFDGSNYTVVPSDGPALVADQVLVAVGLDANTELAQGAGLEIDRGIIVDPSQRTSNPAVYAIGDAARIRQPNGALGGRHEHWAAAMADAQIAAAAILEHELPPRPISWMWSDRYGVHLEAIGSMESGEEVVRIVDGLPKASFAVDTDGRLLGAASIDDGNLIRSVRRLMEKGVVVPREQLADPSVNLKKLTH